MCREALKRKGGEIVMKIDITKIEGYENMTAEEKLTALENYEMADADYSGYIKKDLFDKTASELSDLKKKHRALLSDEEQKQIAANEEMESLRAELNELKKKETIANHKAQYLAIGYSEELADKSALAMAEGDIAKVFANQKLFLEEHDKQMKVDLLKSTPTPPGGSAPSTMTKERLQGMTSIERLEFSKSHPEEYKAIYGGNDNGSN